MSKITVVLVDDHPVVRAGIKSLISESDRIEIIAEVSNGQEALDALLKRQPNVLITDISMPIMGGLELAVIVKERYPNTKVLIITMHMEHEYIIKGFESGIMGYLPKDSDQTQLFEAIETISNGNKYLTKEVSAVLAQSMIKNRKPEDVEEELTKRENDVLKLLVDGLRNKEIGDKLSISVRTVDTHRTNIMRKLKVNNTAELVKKALREQLVS